VVSGECGEGADYVQPGGPEARAVAGVGAAIAVQRVCVGW